MDAMWYFGHSAAGAKFVEHASAVNVKRTWTDWGETRDWSDPAQVILASDWLIDINAVF